MSFSRPPKNAYGDTDYTQDLSSDLSATPPFGDQNPLPASREFGAQSPGQPQQTDLVGLTRSITPEDKVFMNNWRRDSFFMRVLPLSAVCTGSLFLYNKKNNRPHKFVQYFALVFGSYAVGKISYLGELRRRITESRLNTPYMQALRRAVGAKPLEESGFDNTTTNMEPVWDYGSTDQFPGENLSLYPDNIPQFEDTNSQRQESDKHGVSYQDLRARNRGYTR